MTDQRGPDPEPARCPDCGAPVDDDPDQTRCQPAVESHLGEQVGVFECRSRSAASARVGISP